MINTFDNPIYNLWYTDGLGNKVSVTKTNETYKVVDNKIFLTHIPDKLIKVNSIIINSTTIYEVAEGSIINENNFTVDYELGLITTSSIYDGQTAIVSSYAAKGSIMFPMSRIYDDQNSGNGTIIRTLDQLLEDIENNANNIVTALIDSITHLGEYDPDYTYIKNNEVSYYGNSFIATQTTINNPPTIGGVVNSTYWRLSAKKGDSGSNCVSKGVYVSETAYAINDLVIYQGNVYECIAPSTGNLPTNTDYFRPFLTSTSVSSYKNTYTISGADTNTVPIGISAFNKDTDILYVYENSTYIEVTEDYTIDSASENIIKVSGVWAGTNATIFNFIVLKNVNQAYYADGRLIENGTISLNKLTTTLSNQVQNLTTMFVNVKDFGAVGDGVHDDTTAIQDAIDSLPQANSSGLYGGGKIYFPRGIYAISSPLIIQNHNILICGEQKNSVYVKPLLTFVGDYLLKWNTGGNWLYISNCSIENITFDIDSQVIGGVLLESWYNNCNLNNINITKFKDRYGLTIQPSGVAGEVSILQGITLSGVEVNPFTQTSVGSVLLHGLYESSIINCKFWSTNVAGVSVNNVDVVTLKRCRGLNIFGGSAASGNNGYVIIGDSLGSSRNINFYGATVENVSKGIYFKGGTGDIVYYCTINGLRSVTPITHEIYFDYCLGCKVDIQTNFTAIELTANANSCSIVGFNSGGIITDNGVGTSKMLYNLTDLNINKNLTLKNGTKFYDTTSHTNIYTSNNTFRVLNTAGDTVLAEISNNQALFNAYLRLTNQQVTTIAPSAGAAGALPATPSGYMTVKINGVDRLIPYY